MLWFISYLLRHSDLVWLVLIEQIPLTSYYFNHLHDHSHMQSFLSDVRGPGELQHTLLILMDQL